MRCFGGPVSLVVLYTKRTDNQDRCTIAPELLDLFLRRPLRNTTLPAEVFSFLRSFPTRFSFLGGTERGFLRPIRSDLSTGSHRSGWKRSDPPRFRQIAPLDCRLYFPSFFFSLSSCKQSARLDPSSASSLSLVSTILVQDQN
jgi:hypothetical protein